MSFDWIKALDRPQDLLQRWCFRSSVRYFFLQRSQKCCRTVDRYVCRLESSAAGLLHSYVLGVWRVTKKSSSDEQRRGREWHLDVFGEVRQWTRIEHGLDFYQHGFKFFTNNLCISQCLLQTTINCSHHPLKKPIPERSSRYVEPPIYSMQNEKGFQEFTL